MFKKKEDKTPKELPNLELDTPTIKAGTESQSLADPEQDPLLINYRHFKGFFERDVISLMGELIGRLDKLESKLDELIETIKKVSE